MNVFLRLLPFLRPYAGKMTLNLVVSALLSALSVASIAIIWPILNLIFGEKSSATDAVAPIPSALGGIKEWFMSSLQSLIIDHADTLTTLRNLCAAILLIFIAKNLAKYFGNLLTVSIEENMMKDIRDRIFQKTTELSLGFFNARRSGELMSLVTNDVGMMNGALTPTLSTIIREPLQAIIMLLFLISFSPVLTLVAFSTSILSLVLIRVLTKHIKKYSMKMSDALGEITSRLQETFQNIRIIKGYAAERFEVKRFRKETEGYVRSAIKHSLISNLMSPMHELFAISALSVVLFYGGYQVLHGELAASELLTFLFLLFAIMQPINSIVSIPTTIQRGLVAGERVLGLLDTPPMIVGGERRAPGLKNELQLLNVDFEYRPGVPVVRDMTLTVKRGQTVALVGPSGGGKSTVMDLIVRFYDPINGGIYLDGVDIREFDLESYHSLFGIVTQESILFNDTVFDNIAYNLEDVTEEMVIAAAKAANAHEFISRLPQGYRTKIGDRGVLLSGGQRQRLAIARALVRDPQVLLFDEATSALDTESEMLVQEAINSLLEDRTAVVIAHRLSTIKHAHMIVVVENGQIAEWGTHEELLAGSGVYRKLYEVQFREE